MISALLFITFIGITLTAVWLFARRAASYTRWIYLTHALGFTCLAVGTLPSFDTMTLLGVIINIVAVGLGLACKFLVELHQENGMDIRTGKLTHQQ
jgi:hypothetical protein